ncbi:hypothetical protein ABH942_000257 [Flavobacterium sp. 28YEA47A]|uniref:hypothetical protein n=1 Tax=Flavobacterium sp. 28YEA47A TaxID=3156276 RepID=UPI003514873A
MDDTIRTLILKHKEFMDLAEVNIKHANSIKEVLQILGHDIDRSIESISNSLGSPNLSSGFPLNDTKRAQALWILRDGIGKAAKMPDIQDLYVKLIGREDDIQMTVRTLKKKGRIANHTYGTNKDTYWGLPEWHDGTDFKEEYRPEI